MQLRLEVQIIPANYELREDWFGDAALWEHRPANEERSWMPDTVERARLKENAKNDVWRDR